MVEQRIAWHPGFASAIQLELAAYRDVLVYETERGLNRQPLRIDVLVVKKDSEAVIENDLALLFRGHNILEFKSERDGLTIDDLYKTLAYGCLYKAYGPTVDAIDGKDVTLTLVRRGVPPRLFEKLGEQGCAINRRAPGVYWVDGLMFPTQMVATRELDTESHLWLASLGSGLEREQVKELVVAAGVLTAKEDRALADAVLDVVTRANSDVVKALKGGEDAMIPALYEIMKPEIDAAIEQGVERGMKQGMEQGIERGMERGIRAVIERMLRRGGFSQEEIADIAGTTPEEVQNVAAALHLSLA